MKKEEIKVGCYYIAKVSNKLTTVKVISIDNRPAFGTMRASTVYNCINIKTQRNCSFKSAASFRNEVPKSEVLKITPPASKLPPLDIYGKPCTEEEFKDLVAPSEVKTDADGFQYTAPTPEQTKAIEEEMKVEAKLSEVSAIEKILDTEDRLAEETEETVTCPDCSHEFEDYQAFENKCPECGHKWINRVKSNTFEERFPFIVNAADKERERLNRIVNETAEATFPSVMVEDEDSSNPTATISKPVSKGVMLGKPSASKIGLGDLIRKSKAEEVQRVKAITAPHMVIKARAGTGKTTTLVEGLKELKGIPAKITPSVQQKAIWDVLCQNRGSYRSVCFAAFNKPIAEELKGRVPTGCDATTMHSAGLKCIFKAFSGIKVDEYRVVNIISEILEKDIKILRKESPTLIQATQKLVGLCKVNLIPTDVGSPEDQTAVDILLQNLASHYEVDLVNEQTGVSVKRDVFELVPKVLERCRNVSKDRTVDFNDMIWLPVVLNLPMFRYDLLLVDEAQDLNPCQQSLARKMGNRLVLCGDDKQAIYAFAGADSNSIPNMIEQLEKTERGCVVLPLTVTRRCGKAIVKEANTIVPDFFAHESNGEGTISNAAYPIQGGGRNSRGEQQPTVELPFEQTYLAQVKGGDFVLCRCNAPLISQCFRMLRHDIRARIQGRDIGTGLINLIEKLVSDKSIWQTSNSLNVFVDALEGWASKEVAKENAKKNPSESKLIAIQDKVDCLFAFVENTNNIGHMVERINTLFSDTAASDAGVCLSSIHKAKGLEAKRVFFMTPKGAECPHPMAKSEWQRGQEYNLRYVAITRAIETLVYVS